VAERSGASVSFRLYRWPLAAAFAAFCAAYVPPDASAQLPEKGKYGKTLVAHFRVPPETVAKYASFTASPPKPGDSPVISAITADSVDWVSPVFDVKTSGNPHTLVVTMTGSAKADGGAGAIWTAGWKLDTGMTVQQLLPGLAKPEAKAGEWFMVTGASPTTFKEDRSVAVDLGLVRARNMEIASVQIDVWSGAADVGFWDVVGTWPGRLVIFGLVLMVLWRLGFRRPRR
jgi:hypothetical protein